MAVVAAIAAALVGLGHVLWVVPSLPEPTDHPATEQPKVRYGEVFTPYRALGCFAAFLCAGQVMWLLPAAQWPVWICYIGGGGALIAVDLYTTYLPRRLNYIVVAEVALTIFAWAAVAGWSKLAWPVIGGLGSMALLWLLWRFSGGIGFGDVRLGFLVGAIASLNGPMAALSALLLGSLVGAAWGVVHQLTRRRRAAGRHFPYGPALWLGPILLIPVTALVG